MRRTFICGMLVLLFISPLLAQSFVPLAAVEANDDTAIQPDTPTPFPKPPTPRPVPDTAQSFMRGNDTIRTLTESATWWTYTGNALTWHDCAARADDKLRAGHAPAEVREFLVGLAREHSASLVTSLAPFRLQFVASVRAENQRRLAAGEGLIPIGSVNATWSEYVGIHSEEIAASFAPTQDPLPGCTPPAPTGRCDCNPCLGTVCDCQLWQPGMEDCSIVTREGCNVDYTPEPTAGNRTLDVNWGR